VAEWAAKNELAGRSCVPYGHGTKPKLANEPGYSLATYAAMSRELGLPLRFPGTKEGWNTLQETTDAELCGRATLWALV